MRFLRYWAPWLAVYVVCGTLLKDLFIRGLFLRRAGLEKRLLPIAVSTALAGLFFVNPWVIPEVMALLGCPPPQVNAQGLPSIEFLHAVVLSLAVAVPCVLDQLVWRVAGRLRPLASLRWAPRVVPSILGGLIASVVAMSVAALAIKALDLL